MVLFVASSVWGKAGRRVVCDPMVPIGKCAHRFVESAVAPVSSILEGNTQTNAVGVIVIFLDLYRIEFL